MERETHEQFPEGYKWVVMAIVSIATMMATLDSSIVNVSIPAIMADFGVGIDDIEWTMTGYMLAFATLMPLTGWLRDRIGYRNIFIASLFIFTLGSVLCGFAWNLQSLIGARVIQAFGGGALMPTGMAMITEVFPQKERGKAMGIWGIGIIAGPAIGPTLGGYLTNYFGWRSIFLVNLPVGIIAFMAAYEMLMKDKPHKIVKRPFDFWGFSFLLVFLVTILLGMSKGQKEGWFSPFILTCFILSFLSFIGFLLVELHIDNKIVDLDLFKYPVFTIAAIISVVRSIGLFGGTFLIPLFVQQQMGYNELQSGLMMLPAALFMALLFPFVGRMSDKVGPMVPSVIGLFLMAASLFAYKTINLNTSVWDIIYPMLIRSLGMALLMAPVTAASMNAIPQSKIGMASSMNSIIQQVGASLGIAFFATSLSTRASYHIGVLSQGIKTGTSPLYHAVNSTMKYAYSGGAVYSQEAGVAAHAHSAGITYLHAASVAKMDIFTRAIKSAMVMSFQDAFMVGAFIVALAIPIAFFLPKEVVLRHGSSKNKPETVTNVIVNE